MDLKKMAEMKKIILLLSLLPLLFSCGQQQNTDIVHPVYRVQVKINPEDQFLDVSGQLTIPADKVSDTVSLYLHRQFDIRQFSLNGDRQFSVDTSASGIRYLPEAMKIFFPTEEKHEMSVVDFSYSGRITERPEWLANVISEEWTEIGLYFPWFPFHPDLRPLEYELDIEIDTAYTVFAMGERSSGDNRIHYKTIYPTNDIVVCAARDLKLESTAVAGNDFHLGYYSLEPHVVDSMMMDIGFMYSKFNEWFGSKDGSMYLAESKRKSGGAYGRLGGLFLPGFEEAGYLEYRTGYLRYLGHELAHNWWYRADSDTWHDWLNECFAEYSALMLIREKSGRDEFNRRIESYTAGMDTLPPLWNLNRSHDYAYPVLYRKGPVLLSELEDRMGEYDFKIFCRELVASGADETDDLLAVLRRQQGGEAAEWFETLLKTR